MRRENGPRKGDEDEPGDRGRRGSCHEVGVPKMVHGLDRHVTSTGHDPVETIYAQDDRLDPLDRLLQRLGIPKVAADDLGREGPYASGVPLPVG